MLHIVRVSGFSSQALSQCLTMCLADDSILLLDDGCYNLANNELADALAHKKITTVFFVEEHAKARAQYSNDFKPITLADVLPLIFNHNNTTTWS